jgi:hypothetical protein
MNADSMPGLSVLIRGIRGGLVRKRSGMNAHSQRAFPGVVSGLTPDEAAMRVFTLFADLFRYLFPACIFKPQN